MPCACLARLFRILCPHIRRTPNGRGLPAPPPPPSGWPHGQPAWRPLARPFYLCANALEMPCPLLRPCPAHVRQRSSPRARTGWPTERPACRPWPALLIIRPRPGRVLSPPAGLAPPRFKGLLPCAWTGWPPERPHAAPWPNSTILMRSGLSICISNPLRSAAC